MILPVRRQKSSNGGRAKSGSTAAVATRDPASHHEGARSIRPSMGRPQRIRAAIRDGREERRVLPRREADPRSQLHRVSHEEVAGTSRESGTGRRRADGSGRQLRDAARDGAAHESAGDVPASGARSPRTVRQQIESGIQERSGRLGAAAGLALCAPLPVAAEPAGVEDLRRTARRVPQRGLRVRARAGRPLVTRVSRTAVHQAGHERREQSSRESRVPRRADATAVSGRRHVSRSGWARDQSAGPQRRGSPDDRAMDRSRLPD